MWASWLGRKDWETSFFNSCKSKTRLKIMKTWHVVMTLAPTCYGNFPVRFAKAHTLKINKVILEQVLSRYKSETQLLLKNHICVLGWISRYHARDGSEIQTSGRFGSAGKIEKLGFLIPVIPKHTWKSWNLAWCHDMAPTCCSNFLDELGQALV